MSTTGHEHTHTLTITMKNLFYSLLRKSERYLKTDMVYIAKGGFWLTLGQMSTAALILLSSFIFANYFPIESYGVYKYVLSVAGILGAISLTGMSSIIVQSVSREEDMIIKLALKESLRWNKSITIISLLISIYYLFQNNSLLALAFLITSILLPVIVSFGIYGSYLNGKKLFKENSLFLLYSQIVNVALLIITVLITNNVLILVLIYFATNAATALYFYLYVLKKYPPKREADPSLLKFGKHISLMNFFGTLANQLDKILVFNYLGPTNLAIYVFSTAIPEQIKGSFKNLFAIALPKYAELEEAKLRPSITKKATLLTFIAAFIALSYIIISPYIFKILFPKYIDSIFYSQIYVIGIIAIPGISLLATYFQIKRETKIMYKLSLIGNTTTVILTFFLIRHFGLLGAVIENSLSWLIMLLAHIFYFSREKRN